jgi:hypothetical protein
MSNGAPLTEAEVKAFVEDWYLVKLDQHYPIDDLADMVADENLEMVFPEETVTTKDGFKQWYDRIIHTFFDEVHVITDLKVTPAGDRADVKVVVNWQTRVWQAPKPKSTWLGFDAYQTWVVIRSPRTGKPVIQRYVVDDFVPMPGSGAL